MSKKSYLEENRRQLSTCQRSPWMPFTTPPERHLKCR